MSIEENKAIVCRFVDHTPAPGDGADRDGYVKGIATLRATFVAAFPDFGIKLDDVIAEGDIVACRVSVQGRQVVPLWGMAFVRLRDGKVVELWQEQNVRIAEAAAT